VILSLREDAFAFWHPVLKKWTVELGMFEVLIGSSSRDIRIQQLFEM
jgi:beta-glucosidase